MNSPSTPASRPRSRLEADDWGLAGELGTGLDRAVTALAIHVARAKHATAEGVEL